MNGKYVEEVEMKSTINSPTFIQRISPLTISSISYQWSPVNSSENIPYSFPNEITDYMKLKYGFPALYRWVIRRSDGSVLYYLGETEGLVPKRIYQYLKPDPTQKTNQRLHKVMHSEIQGGSKILLEYLSFSPFKLNNHEIIQSSLMDAHIRRLLEELFTVLFLKNGERVLNK